MTSPLAAVAALIDISPPLTPAIAVWPGDVAFSQDYALRLDRGDNLDLSSIASTLHVGAHADGPSHYGAGAAGIGERSLDLYYGPCQVIDVVGAQGRRIQPVDLRVPVQAPRVLLRTGSFPDPNHFSRDFASLSPALIHILAGQGVVLVGIDTPSIDPFDSTVLESHHAMLSHDLAILEGLVLGHVQAGLYTLLALPLRIPGADASPVRAALLPSS